MSFCSRVGAGRRQRRSKSRRVWRSAPRREGEASATKAGMSHSGQTSDPSDFSTTEKARDEARSTPSERRARRRRARKSSDAARDSQKEKPDRRFESGASSASGDRTRRGQKAGFAQRGQHAARNIRRAGDVGGAEERGGELPGQRRGRKAGGGKRGRRMPVGEQRGDSLHGQKRLVFAQIQPRRVIPDALADEQQKMPRTTRVGGHHGGLQRAQQAARPPA